MKRFKKNTLIKKGERNVKEYFQLMVLLSSMYIKKLRKKVSPKQNEKVLKQTILCIVSQYALF